ncbi:hypothetical protein HS088_TW13G01635 [Tripterygium wilfordii]|uniref:MORF/ORRM1/DAG-like MORF domain-containing protein n=1 Tax=Tripterygium wilfordii TaxID=458696 RepID=A0A7J7CXG0_TRIWF|nr:hypothetical protein HS088_TW13G01635 [Tripterygium wilfordii]
MAHITARRTVASLVTRALSSSTPTSFSSPPRFAFALTDKIPLPHLLPNPVRIPVRPQTSGSGYSPLNDPSPNWSNRPPKETILLDGCDYEHWLIVMEFNDPQPNEEEMKNSYVKTLAQVLGSEEEAKKKIYSVCTTTYTGFGALISEEHSHKGTFSLMGKSSIGHSFGTTRVNQLGIGLAHGMIETEKQARLSGDSQFKHRAGTKIRSDSLRSNQWRWMALIRLMVEQAIRP